MVQQLERGDTSPVLKEHLLSQDTPMDMLTAKAFDHAETNQDESSRLMFRS